MTQRRALGDLDFDSAFDDPDNGWFGHVPAVGPVLPRDLAATGSPPVDAETQDIGETGTQDTDRWPVITVDDAPAPYVEDPPPTYEAPVEPRASRWADAPAAASPSFESRFSSSGAWDFKASAAGPPHRSKYALAVLIAAGVAVAGVVLLVRSPGPADVDSGVVPSGESTVRPTPTTAPALSTPSQAPLPPGPPGPPPPPPPPPPSAEELTPPVVTRDYTPRRQNAPDDSAKPELGVTRAPATRTQMSATPPPPPRVPDRNSSTPGDGRKRNGFGF